MFNGKYFQRNEKLAKGIVDFYGFKFFYFKKVLDLGCGHGDLGGVLYRLGADVSAVDARQEHLKIVNKKFPGIKVIKSNLDGPWSLPNQKTDLILDLGLLCHLANYEEHLRAVCAHTTHLVLETAVCDSDDDQKCLIHNEDKNSYDLSYNGKGCRPSAAAIERVLKYCGMNFKRMDNSKFNSAEYQYDWLPKNDGSYSPEKRKIWFCVKENSPVQFAKPASEIVFEPTKKNTTVASIDFIKKEDQTVRDKIIENIPIINNKIDYFSIVESKNQDQVKIDSQNYAIIKSEKISTKPISDLNYTILPYSYSSKQWFKKISSFFPKLKLSNQVKGMTGFETSDLPPQIIMCSINKIKSHNRLWLDEWSGHPISDKHISILKKCGTIITPSLINAQEILKHIPDATVIRVAKPWPILNTNSMEGDYYLYFEKDPKLTKLLFKAWEDNFGKLIVIGSTITVPHFATFISKYSSYEEVSKYILGCKGIIDLSDNIYYMSGILKLAESLKISIITTNHMASHKNIISQDKKINCFPTIESINSIIKKCENKKAIFTEDHNKLIVNDLKKIMGI